jgi:hypothetical protein
MCYVCREGLGVQNYNHFCQHFRDRPGSRCSVCDKCDLYRVEDEDIVVKRAKEQAEREWWEKQGNSAGEGMKKGAGQELKGFSDGSILSRRWNPDSWLEKILESVV